MSNLNVDKILFSDGSMRSSDGRILEPASEIGRIMFRNTAPRIGKIMKPDGEVIENYSDSGGGGSVGPPGPAGPGVTISVLKDTEDEYILEIVNEGGETITTPNLKRPSHVGFY